MFRLPDPPGDDSAEVAERKTLVVRAILSGFPENGVQTRKGGMSTLSEHSTRTLETFAAIVLRDSLRATSLSTAGAWSGNVWE